MEILSLFVVTDDIADADGFTLEGNVERDGRTRKNQAPDFFHS